MKYKHLFLEERERIYSMRQQGLSWREIGCRLKRPHTTLSREYKRNSPYFQEYIPCRADQKAQTRGSKQRSKAPLKAPLVFCYVREKLREGWSPEIISGRIGIDNPGYSIHHETIYSYIYARCNRRLHLEKYLTLKRRKRRRQRGRGVQTYSKIKNAISIEKRPKKVERRKEVGHWETDLMEGPRRSKVVVQANVERKTRFVVVSKSSGKTADTNSKLLITRLGKFPPKALKTITGDNGPENSDHQVVSKNLKVQFYFCHPYHSWEKGTGENTIGRLRRYIPKGVCIGKYSHKQIQQIEDRMNGTPRKCLNYLTPREALCKELKLNI